MNFPGQVTNQKVVANGLIYLNMDFQPNWSFQTGENGQKPSKMAIFDKKLLIKKNKKIFSTYWSNKVCFPYPPLTSCQKSKKSDKIFRAEIFTQSNP